MFQSFLLTLRDGLPIYLCDTANYMTLKVPHVFLSTLTLDYHLLYSVGAVEKKKFLLERMLEDRQHFSDDDDEDT